MLFFVTNLYDSCRTETKFTIYITINYKFFQPMKNEFHKSQVEAKRGKSQRPKTINYYEKVGSNITNIYWLKVYVI